jgi:hypothetical protein
LISCAQKHDSSAIIKWDKEIIKNALADKSGKQILVDKINRISNGKDQILGEKPYSVHFLDGYWLLSGSLPERKGYDIVGGTFLIILSEKDGRVIKLTHGK